jgi:hypothetical protein
MLTLKNFPEYEVEYVHVTHGALMDFDINEYDVVFQNYCARLCFDGYVSEHYQNALMNFRGLKIIAVQDDYDRTATLHRAIRRLGFHVVLTCIQKEFWPIAYPKSELPGVTIVQGLTGYMPERMLERKLPVVPLPERKCWIAYRGRTIGARYGRLGFDKYEIGRRMAEICTAKGIPHDIAVDYESRIYGDAWFEFLGSSRTMLGSESASNAFDFDGRLEEAIQAFTVSHGRAPAYHELKHVIDPLEAPFNVGQISPRVFETAVMRTPMILFRGSYSGVIEADKHYIPLEKDFANAADVLARLNDLEYLQGLADRVYERLVSSGQYGYRTLGQLLQETIELEYPRRVDPKWVAYREQISRHWASLGTQTKGVTHRSAAAERPTDVPLGLKEFEARQAAIAKERQAQRHAALEAEREAASGYTDEIARPNGEIVRLGGEIGLPNEVQQVEKNRNSRLEIAHLAKLLLLAAVPLGVRRKVPAPVRQIVRRWLANIVRRWLANSARHP